MMRSLLFLFVAAVLFACSYTDAEREIAQKEAEVKALTAKIDSAKAVLDSVQKAEMELRRELDSLDMSR